MTRFRLDLAYDGTDFHGWAAQPGLRTVEGELTRAIEVALERGALPPSHQLVVAGRTDAGVHARAQVAHLDIEAKVTCGVRLVVQLVHLLPHDIVLHKLVPAPDGFDARFSAIGRTYFYRLWDSYSPIDPIARRSVTVLPVHLDTDAMAAAAASLIGLRDFAAFCRPHDGGTSIRHLRRFDVFPVDGTIECWLEADAFAHSMVRSLVGAVTQVGAGRRDIAWLAGMVAMTSRANDVPVLPPCGLTLEGVAYPPDDQLAARAEAARSLRSLP